MTQFYYRDKLYSTLENFVQEEERSNLSKTCDQLEDWLYDEGEDQPKNVYVERKANLDAQIAPVTHRLKEFESRKGCLDKLTETINYYQKVTPPTSSDMTQNRQPPLKIVGECEAKLPESKYLHLEADDVRKMSEAVAEGWKFLTDANIKLKDLKQNQDPTVSTYEIISKTSYIDNLCKPISKKTPPKVEPPKEETPKENQDENKDTNTEEPMEGTEAAPATDAPAAPATNADDLD
jgi:heat shock protein 4